MTRPRVVVVGSVNMDLVIRAARLPAPGETIAGSGFRTLPGGKGANQAVAAARMGAEVHLVGCTGGDDFGRRLRAGLAADGIGLDHLAVSDDEPTGVAVIILDAGGQNSIVLSPGANGRVTPASVDAAAALIASAQVLVCQLETPLEAVERAIDVARAHAVPVILNPAPAMPLSPGLLTKVDLLVPNETEASILAAMPVADVDSATRAARRLVDAGAVQVLVTLGDQGVVLVGRDGTAATHAAIPVSVVDTTGAGDTFVGCLAAERAAGVPMSRAIGFAQAAAALKVTRLGAQTSIPRRGEVDAFVRGLR